MPGASTTTLTARFLTPDYLIQAQDQTISCPVWQSGALVAPTSGTVSVYDGSNTAVVDGAAVTVTGSIATYAISSSVLPSSLSRGMGWRIEWTLVISGSTYVFRNSAGLIKASLYPVITDADLFRRESALDPSGAAPVSSLSDYQDYLDEAWVTLTGRLAARGSLPHLVMEPSALREPHLLLSLHLIFQDFRTRLSETWTEKASDYRAQFDKAWDSLAFEYDTSDSGQSDGRRKRSASPTVWLGGFD